MNEIRQEVRYVKADVQRIALTGGVVWGGCMLVTTLAGVFWGYGLDFLQVMAGIYPGYNVSVGGSIVGLVYGFLDMYLGVYIFAWVYRKLGK